MPMDKARYPANWKEISLKIRKRARGRCECRGECGLHSKRCTARNYQPHPITQTRVVFTVAHIGATYPDGRKGDKHDKHDVRDENLRAMCQRCHLIFDLKDHVRHAAETRRRKKIRAGQLELLGA